MSKPSRPRWFRRHDTIVTAWCEYAGGPGWSNQPLWVIVRDGDGKFRRECLQPEEQSADMLLLYGVAAALHAALVGAVTSHLGVRS